MLFVGDAMTDLLGAREAGVPFVGRVPDAGPDPFAGTGVHVVRDMADLDRAVVRAGRGAAAGSVTVVVAHQRLVSADIVGAARQWLYAGEDPAWAIERGRGAARRACERVTAGPELAAAAEALRRPYLDWIGELGVANDSFAWWSSQLAAKNVYTHLFQRLCALRVAEERLEDGMLVVCSTPALVAEVADVARRRGLTVAEHPGDRSLVPRARNAAYGPFLVVTGAPARA